MNLDKLGPDHIDVANSYNNLASVYCCKKEYDKAMEFGKKALDLRLKKLDSNHPHVGDTYGILGYINYKKGNKMEAKKFYENALSIYTQKLGKNNQRTQNVILALKKLLFWKQKTKFYFELYSFVLFCLFCCWMIKCDISKVVRLSFFSFFNPSLVFIIFRLLLS
ncbi:hypothetical protein RFI_33033 [Reticulomyxa filosa]|uniref:Uncharacterized protein n=1 Tax=Reticulomyxa filosa TaxID=46433 RepID=X6LR85_RETFI|nr:hypothetical protein RFI_33033 [Reticulomyxa filosa]|eukprot:ETO04363.1 hypothetical protein RFI_33033 [Reticulomyxa filosa]